MSDMTNSMASKLIGKQRTTAHFSDQSEILVDDMRNDKKARYEFIPCERGLFKHVEGKKFPMMPKEELEKLNSQLGKDVVCDCKICVRRADFGGQTVVEGRLRSGEMQRKYGEGQKLGQ